MNTTDRSADVSTQHTSVLYSADLIAESIPRFDGAAFRLAWQIRREPSPELRAGTAVLRPLDSAMSVDFDYADPSVPVGGVVPFGVVVVDEADDDDPWEQLVRGGGFAEIDLAVVTALFGREFVDNLRTTNSFTLPIEPNPTWSTAGRVALAQTSRQRSWRPLDGLWAFEVGTLVGRLGDADAIRRWARHLFAVSAPTMRLFDVRHVGTASGYRARVEHLKSLAERARSLHDQVEIGAWLADLIQADVDRAIAQVEEFLAQAADDDDLVGVRAHPARHDAGALMGAKRDPAASASGREASIAASARSFGVASATWRIDGRSVHVSIAADPRVPVEVVARTEVRVSSVDGQLLASGLSLRPSPMTGQLESELLVPSVDPDDIVVVVGRDLPITGCTASWITAHDRIRTEQTQIDDDRANGRGQEPFVVERLRVAFDRDQVVSDDEIDADDHTGLLGARGLALSFDRDAEAARWEAQRRRLGQRLDDLGISALDRLAVFAGRGGDAAIADELAAAATALDVDE